jgi:hypothetical protein
VEPWVVEAAAADTTPAGAAAAGGVAALTLTSIHGFPHLGHRVSSAGRVVPQWMQTGRFEEVFVMAGRLRTNPEYKVSLQVTGNRRQVTGKKLTVDRSQQEMLLN